ncbi:MAG: glycosyltransferase [Terrimicrobiaceae bacterium]|nr:glycosyltransferase [Terrimicrobiaceae bacterium]
MNLAVIGLSITSSWGNGHATTYRALLRDFARRGHRVVFFEDNKPWYSAHRDQVAIPGVEIILYSGPDDLAANHVDTIAGADAVIVGSYVPDGQLVGDWVLRTARGVRAFYDIDTPVTLEAVCNDECAYLRRGQIAEYDLYFSFTGGPILDRLEKEFGSPAAIALYCAVDPGSYFPTGTEPSWDLGYLGTFAPDRQPGLERFLLEPSRRWAGGRFVVAGSGYPEDMEWPEGVHRISHLPPAGHRTFYGAQRFTLNLTRAAMVRAGFSPSVRLFEAAACGVPVITDRWEGLDTFFEPGREIHVAATTDDVLQILHDLPSAEARSIGRRALARVEESHTSAHRAAELESYLTPVLA